MHRIVGVDAYIDCPECQNSSKVYEIIYGMLQADSEAADRIHAGSAVAGGCCFQRGSPTHFCAECDCYFGSLEL